MVLVKRARGFRLGRRLVRLFSWCARSRRTRRGSASYRRLTPSEGPVSKLRKWVRSLCCGKGKRVKSGGYRQLVHREKPLKLPKGHLAVYVGERVDDTCRVLVPVVYFNHPLFGELLKEAEKVYGFDYSGGIQIPCPRSEVEDVKTRIAAVSGGGVSRRRWSLAN